MINLILKVLMVLSGTYMYIRGETMDGWAGKLGKCNKAFKYWMGVPLALLSLPIVGLAGLLLIPTYWLACNAGYGENNWITKLIGKTNAVILHGTLVGLASIPFLGLWWGLFGGVVSGLGFYLIYREDCKGAMKEPQIALLRGLAGTITLLLG